MQFENSSKLAFSSRWSEPLSVFRQTGFGMKSDFGKSEKNAVKVTAPKIAKSP